MLGDSRPSRRLNYIQEGHKTPSTTTAGGVEDASTSNGRRGGDTRRNERPIRQVDMVPGGHVVYQSGAHANGRRAAEVMRRQANACAFEGPNTSEAPQQRACS
jgi:hypothetical protein